MDGKRALLRRAEKELTNYFTGKNNTTMNFNDKLQIRILNKSTDKSLTVALAAGGIPVSGIDPNTGEFHHHITDRIGDAYGVSAVLDDMTETERADGGIKFDSAATDRAIFETVDKNLSIRHAISYLERNPRYIRAITLRTNNKALYDGAISICSINPFHTEAERSFNLNDYYSVNQYQDDKIIIPFAADQLQWNDLLFMSLQGIPNGSEVTVIVEFY